MKTHNLSSTGNRFVKHFVFVFTLLMSSPGWSQVEFSMGLEGGVNSSGLPIRDEWTSATGASNKKKDLPLIRALGGAWGKVKFREHFYLSAGVQYTSVGSRYTLDSHGLNIWNQANFTSQIREDFTFDKVSCPIMLGYDLRIKKLPVSFFMGYRPSNLMSGKYYYKRTYSDETGRLETDEKHIDPFNDAGLAVKAPRHLKQFMVGAGVVIKNNFHISFFYATGERIAFMEQYPRDWIALWDGQYFRHYYERWDLVLSLKYTLLRIKGNSQTK